ncbi:cytochrome P450 [Skermanella pratensis]|uniref:cytochrome P450 n=1 Tax=Skermanella pratensis TaxID=2233999 RepID=UPI001B3B67CB|nr:cytochrome P450 [Skermanella pratensis]
MIPPRLEPAPAPLPWYRQLKAFRTNALTAWSRQAYELDVMASSFLWRGRVLVSSPDGIRHVLVDNHGNYRRTPASIRVIRPLAGDGLLLSEGERWRHQRQTLAPAFTPRAIPVLVGHIAEATRDALAGIGARAMKGPVELVSFSQHLALDIAGRSMFSVEMSGHGAAMRRLIARYAERLGRPYLLDFLLPAAVPNLHDLARRRFRTEWMGLVETIMAERLKAPADVADKPRDLFDLMRAARDPGTGAEIPAGELRDQVATMIVAGHETTALAIFWSLYLLALAPDVQESVAREAAGLDLSAEGAALALPGLVMTRAVVQEALRLYPPAFVIVREAIGEGIVGGVPVRPGDLVMVSPWVLHRHRKLWRDPDAFDPGRFLPDAAPPGRFAYLPFGAGPRVCIGAQFALAEAVLVVAAMVSTFSLDLPKPHPPVMPTAVITTQPDRAVYFSMSRRAGSEG